MTDEIKFVRTPDNCPICNEPKCRTCRCPGPHSLDQIKAGHGYHCKNGHGWSGSLSFDPNKKHICLQCNKEIEQKDLVIEATNDLMAPPTITQFHFHNNCLQDLRMGRTEWKGEKK